MPDFQATPKRSFRYAQARFGQPGFVYRSGLLWSDFRPKNTSNGEIINICIYYSYRYC